MGYIYCITNLLNSKRYVGKTLQSIQERFKEHCRDSHKERCERRPLYDAMNKYGVENFIVEELEVVEDDTLLDEKEIYWIQELQTYGSNGYNATKGRDGKVLYNHKEIIELANLGYSYSQISEKIGCTKDTIYTVLKANNIKIRKERQNRILQYDLAGNFIQQFFDSREALEWLIERGITQNTKGNKNIQKCCRGDSKSAFGYKWKYLPNFE